MQHFCSLQASELVRATKMGDITHLSVADLQDQVLGMSIQLGKMEREIENHKATITEKDREIHDLQAETANMRATLEANGSDPGDTGATGAEDVATEAMRKRLDRLCKRRSNGTLQVPEHVHEKWKQGGEGRKELRKLLADAGYDKEQFVKLVEIEKEKSKELDLKTEGDFLTEETMKKEGYPENLDIKSSISYIYI